MAHFRSISFSRILWGSLLAFYSLLFGLNYSGAAVSEKGNQTAYSIVTDRIQPSVARTSLLPDKLSDGLHLSHLILPYAAGAVQVLFNSLDVEIVNVTNPFYVFVSINAP